MESVSLGIIGVGGMGSNHARKISEISDAQLTAVCDTDKQKADKIAKELGCKAFYSSTALLDAKCVDAVLVATPHYDHTTIGIEALQKGFHVLVEKPISVHKADCERLIAAHKDKKLVFAAMFNQRTDPHYSKVKKIIEDGELGTIQRVNWIVTNWFRTQSYYNNGGWRATWEGEGGGVLLNQCPHQLDMLQWLCGMPSKVRAFCSISKYHTIEVEDEVTAYLEYENGATGIFISSTGEAPGTNRLEICGDKGKILVEGGNEIQFTKNEMNSSDFCKTSKQAFAKPPVWNIGIPAPNTGGQHKEIIQNFVNAILGKTELIAPAEEGINSVELGNAMLFSSLSEKTIDLPMDGKAYEQLLKKLIKDSNFQKTTNETVEVDLENSFS
jgi:predicted dehydrogenase